MFFYSVFFNFWCLAASKKHSKHCKIQWSLQFLMICCFKKADQTLQNTVFSLTFDGLLLQKSTPNTENQCLIIYCFKKANQTLQNTVFYDYTASLRFKAQQQKTLQNTVFSSTFDGLLLQKSRPNTAKYSVLFNFWWSVAPKKHTKHRKIQCFLQRLMICCFKKTDQTLQNTVFLQHAVLQRHG